MSKYSVRKEYVGEEMCRVDVYKYEEFKKWNIIKTENGRETVLKTLYGSAQLANICVLFFSSGDFNKRDWDRLIGGTRKIKEIKSNVNKAIKNKSNQIKLFNDKAEELIEIFKEDQKLSTLGKLKKMGVPLKRIQNNRWIKVHRYELPIDRVVTLRNDDFKIDGIGMY